MRLNLRKMWASLVVVAMFGIAFVGLSMDTGDHNEEQFNDIPSTTTTDRTRGPGAPRMVLLERFTESDCPPCAYASPNEEIFSDDHTHKDLAVIKYHVWWPGGDDDPMYQNNVPPQVLRTQYYGVGGVPEVFVDGVVNVAYLTTYWPFTYEAYHRAHQSRVSIPSPFTIDMDGELDVSTGFFNVTVEAVDPVPVGDLLLRTVLWFNNVDYPFPPGGNGEDHFEFTFMNFIPDINGRSVTIAGVGQQQIFTETFTIPTEIAAYGLYPAIPVDRSQLGLVAFVQDNTTKEVHQAAVLTFADLSVQEPNGIVVTPPNPNMGDIVGVSARVKNNGEPIEDAKVNFYIDQIGGNPMAIPASTGPMGTGAMKLVPLGIWDTAGFAGVHKVYVMVDSGKETVEYDESNNIAMREITISAPLDVGISQINPFSDGMMYPMSNYTLGGDVENYGQNILGDFDVGIELVQLGPPDVATSVYSEDFELGEAAWTESPGSSSWAYGTPMGAPGPHSGSFVWGTNLAGDYPSMAHDWLMTPIIKLPSAASSVSLDFWHFYEYQVSTWTNPNPPPVLSYDYYNDCGNLWISTDKGLTWELMDHFERTSNFWSQEVYDLSAYAGQSIRIGFELVSDSGGFGYLGWYVDDFTITAMLPTETPVWTDTVRMSTMLDPGAIETMEWKQKMIVGGTFKLYMWTPIGGDQNAANDLMTVTFDIDPTKWRNMLGTGPMLVSSPLILTEANIANIVAPVDPTIGSVMAHDSVTGEWSGYWPTKPASSLTTVDHKMGMWVLSDTDTYIDFTGTIPGATVDIQLEQGWNLVGYPSMTDRTVADALSGVPYDRVEAYDPAAEPYRLKLLTDSDWMTAGQGYWIRVSSQTTWSVLV